MEKVCDHLNWCWYRRLGFRNDRQQDDEVPAFHVLRGPQHEGKCMDSWFLHLFIIISPHKHTTLVIPKLLQSKDVISQVNFTNIYLFL